jgi:hypothetical protein
MSLCIYSVCRQRPCDWLIPRSRSQTVSVRIKKLKNCQGPKGCRAIEREGRKTSLVQGLFNLNIRRIHVDILVHSFRRSTKKEKTKHEHEIDHTTCVPEKYFIRYYPYYI